MNLRECDVLVIDNALFPAIAEVLGRSFRKAYYYSEYVGAFPRDAETAVGEGLENVTRVYDLWKCIGDLDKEHSLIVFPDVFYGGMCEFLRDLGYRCWGAGRDEKLELDRRWCKEQMAEHKIPVGDYWNVQGTEGLKALLKRKPGLYSKGRYARVRHDTESKGVKSFDLCEGWFDKLEQKLGRRKAQTEFVVEAPLNPAVEIGSNRYCIGGRFPEKSDVALEVKGDALISHVVDSEDFPTQLSAVDDILVEQGYLGDQYRQFFTVETRVDEAGIGFPIDPCCRFGRPMVGTVLYNILNLAEVMWEGADGNLVEPKYRDEYVVELMIECPSVETQGAVLEFPDSIARFVFLSDVCVSKGKRTVLPADISNVGSVVAGGDTLDEAIALVKKRAKLIEGDNLVMHTESLDTAVEQIGLCAKHGVRF